MDSLKELQALFNQASANGRSARAELETAQLTADYVQRRLMAGDIDGLPCRIGDTVWILDESLVSGEWGIIESRVAAMWLGGQGNLVVSCRVDCPLIGNSLEYLADDFGKSVFTSFAAAEAARKEREANHEQDQH